MDQAPKAGAGLQGAVVIRLDNRTQSATFLKSDVIPQNEEMARALVENGQFQTLPAAHQKSELDNVGGTSSWYWYCGPRYNTYFYYYGYTYYPVYTYTWGYYTYAYYWYRW